VEAWEDAQNHQDTEYYYGAAKHPGAVTRTVYPDSDDVTVAYNDDGTVNTRTDQRDWTVTYTYDDARRVTQESVSGNGLVGTSAVTYGFDALGRPTSVTDNNDPNDANDNSTVEWTYTREADGDLRIEEEQEYGTYTDRTVTVTYDLSGRMKSLAYPSGLTLSYTHDDIGRVTAVNDGTNDRVADTYKGWLLEKRTYASDAYLTHLDDQGQNLSGYGFDTFGRVKNHRWKSSGGTLLAGWSHDYDRIGNKKYQEDLQSATQSELYGYDDVYRVTGFKRGQLNGNKDDITSPSRTQTWTLDPLGNWDNTVLDGTTETRTHNTINELTARTVGEDPQISLLYGAAGNLTQDGDSDGDHKYAWDYRNRLIEVEEKQSGNWNTTAEYKYDARNRRVLKVVTNKGSLNGTTRFLWGGSGDWQCLEERDASGDLVARYTYAPGYIDAVAVQERDLNADDDFGDSNEVVYYHSNTLFSVYALSDGNESVIERYRYDAYGACTVLDADGSTDADGLSDVANPYAFTGRRLDVESRLMQYRNRYYAPTLGRLISRDPQGYGDGYALYVYVSGAPSARTDPLGSRERTLFRIWSPFEVRYGPPDEDIGFVQRSEMPGARKAFLIRFLKSQQCVMKLVVVGYWGYPTGMPWAASGRVFVPMGVECDPPEYLAAFPSRVQKVTGKPWAVQAGCLCFRRCRRQEGARDDWWAEFKWITVNLDGETRVLVEPANAPPYKNVGNDLNDCDDCTVEYHYKWLTNGPPPPDAPVPPQQIRSLCVNACRTTGGGGWQQRLEIETGHEAGPCGKGSEIALVASLLVLVVGLRRRFRWACDRG